MCAAYTKDTIVAVATPPGRGGIGVIRISGEQAWNIAEQVCGSPILERKAKYCRFIDGRGNLLDSGLAIGFKAPHSFTGENVVELQGHGAPVVLDLILESLVNAGARVANPGEFSQRAFLNDKVDLAQAEAIADLINSSTKQAALGAVRSLDGEFSNKIQALLQQLIYVRSYVEAAIDFPEEEIDFLADEGINKELDTLQADLVQSLQQANNGAILTAGVTVVLAGKPNAGKSSLLNYLAGKEAAIVTDIAGTTRDIVSQTIDLDGMPLHVIDTAGLRDTQDTVEKIGVERAKQAIDDADVVLHLIDVTDADAESTPDNDGFIRHAIKNNTTITVYTKSDLNPTFLTPDTSIAISVINDHGISELKSQIKQAAGFIDGSETTFTARRRHIDALQRATQAVQKGRDQLQLNRAGELLADELTQAQYALSEITGEFTADDLLGNIFGAFCIGK